jgi:FkbM family methyltransferase
MTWMKDVVKTKPWLYDLLLRRWPLRTETEKWLDRFSRALGRSVSFIQVGANDGIRSDPVRPFIIRDRWEGILVEPLPAVFQMLKGNYAHLRSRNLVFVNAAISDKEDERLTFWSFSSAFLAPLTLEERLGFLRLSSLDRQQVEKCLVDHPDIGEKIEPFSVPVMSVNSLVEKYWNDKMTDLIIIDAEGHDDVIINGIDFDKYRPKAIFYESHHLGARAAALQQYLSERDYLVNRLEGDSVAIDKSWGFA